MDITIVPQYKIKQSQNERLPWTIITNGIESKEVTYEMCNIAKDILETLEHSSTPLNAKQIAFKNNITTATVHIKCLHLMEIGVVCRLKVQTTNAFYYIRQQDIAFKVTDEHTLIEKEKNSHGTTRSIALEIIQPPIHDPNSTDLDLPYIPPYLSKEEIESALADFKSGITDNFQRATLIKNGTAYENEGRFVYIGDSKKKITFP